MTVSLDRSYDMHVSTMRGRLERIVMPHPELQECDL